MFVCSKSNSSTFYSVCPKPYFSSALSSKSIFCWSVRVFCFSLLMIDNCNCSSSVKFSSSISILFLIAFTRVFSSFLILSISFFNFSFCSSISSSYKFLSWFIALISSSSRNFFSLYSSSSSFSLSSSYCSYFLISCSIPFLISSISIRDKSSSFFVISSASNLSFSFLFFFSTSRSLIN